MPARAKKKKGRRPLELFLASYWRQTQLPLPSLIFILPMIVAYELALPIWGVDRLRQVSQDIYARRLLYDFFNWFGITGYLLPALAVIAVLLAWHVIRKDPWTLQPRVYGLMLVESALWALPLLVLLQFLSRHLIAMSLANTSSPNRHANLVFSIGAGIYEELLFRLVAIALIHLLLVDVLALPAHVGAAAAVGLSALLFSLYHFAGPETFDGAKFILLTLAGIYLAGIYILRGFGIAAGAHAIYDVLVVLISGV